MILVPSSAVKLMTTAPSDPASWTSRSAIAFASVMGTFVRCEVVGMPFDFG